MKFFSTVFYGIIGSILFLCLVVEGYGQDRSCLLCQPNPNSAANRFDLGTVNFTNALGEPIDFSDCPDEDELHITITYSTGQNRNRVVFISTLEITTNTGPNNGQVREVEFDLLLGNLPASGPGFVSSQPIKIDLPISFDCQSETAKLKDIQINWTGPGNSNICEGFNYPPGQCANLQNDTRVISSDQLFFSFRSIETCYEEDDRIWYTFVLTNVAGGNGEYGVVWNISINGELTTVSGTLPDPDLLFVTIPGFPGDNIVVDVNVVDTEDLEMVNPPGAKFITPVPEPFQVSLEVLPNVEGIDPFPNGSIKLTNLDPLKNFTFEWLDENGFIRNFDDPTNPTGLEDGTYFLFMTDEEGVVRCFSRTITFVPTPVIYANLFIEYNSYLRSANFSWSTTKEWEASHFEVERAVRGTEFEKIGEVKAKGWSDELTEYSFEDNALPLVGGNILYRLKQVDFNGDFEYSRVLSVRIPGVEFTSGVWRAFPNPTDGNELRISLLDPSQYNQEPLIFRLIHPTAQTRSITVTSESEMNEMLSQMLLKIPKGVFVVEIQWGQKVEHIKVLRQ